MPCVVVQEAFGVNDHIESICDRFAGEGYHAVAPHVFHRSGGGTAPYDDFSKVLPHFGALSDDGVPGRCRRDAGSPSWHAGSPTPRSGRSGSASVAG